MLTGLDAGTRWPAMHPSHVKMPPPPTPSINHLPLIESKQFVVHPLAFAAVLQMLGEAPCRDARCGRTGKQRAAARRNWKHLRAILSPRALRGMSAGTSYLAAALLRGLPRKKKKIQATNNPPIGEETTFRGGKTRR